MANHGRVFNLEFAYIARLSSDLNVTGQLDPDNVGVGPTLSPAYFIKGGMKLSTAKATRRSAEWSAYGSSTGKRQGGIDSIGTGSLEVNEVDATLTTLINGGLIDTTTLVGAEITADNNANPNPNQLCFVGIATIDVPGGGTVYKHFVYPNCTISKTASDISQLEGQAKNPNTITLTIEPNMAEAFPVGVAFSATQDWYGYQEFAFELDTANPMFLDTWIADGTATTFNLSALPKFSTVTGGKNDNWVTKNGVPTAPTSISTSTKAVVISGAGSAADVWNIWYPVAASVLKALANAA